jgi:hypothetical protein
LPASSFGAQRGIDQRIDLPVNSLAPGRYLLTVSTRPGGATAQQSDERRQLVFVMK